MTATTRISLVRHGEIANPQEVYQGRLPGFPLSRRGREQAHAAGQRLRGTEVSAIYTSPMQRARQTAEILRQTLTTPTVTIETLLNEVLSPFDGQPRTEMEARHWDLYAGVGDGYEQPEEVLARVLAFFDLARARHPGEHIVGVTHADLVAFAWVWEFEQPLTPGNRRRLRDFGLEENYPSTASISTFLFREGEDACRPSATYVVPYAEARESD